jgi:two-component system LytT family response regulator
MIDVLIVDDEKAAVENLNLILSERYSDRLNVVGIARNALEAIARIQELKPSLVFLDVEMPNGDGFEVLKCIPEKAFSVIFVTSHSEYAIKAIKHSAFDYLLKPIDLEELDTSLNNVLNRNQRYQRESERAHIISVPQQDGMLFLPLDKVTRIDADGNYSIFRMLDDQKIMASRNLKNVEADLDDRFFRAHISHIVNMNFVTRIFQEDGFRVQMQDGSDVPLAKRRKEEFLARINSFID